MSEGSSHHLSVLDMGSSAQHTEVPAAHVCHEAMAEPLSQDHALLATLHDSKQPSDCHDGHCQLCGVCHQGLSLTAWPLMLPVFQAHPLPISASWMHLARTSAPLTKPPIS